MSTTACSQDHSKYVGKCPYCHTLLPGRLAASPPPSQEGLDTLIEQLNARTFSRYESDIRAVMDYEDELCLEAAAALSRLRADLAKATDPQYLATALEKVGVVDAEWQTRAEAAEAEVTRLQSALTFAEAWIGSQGTSYSQQAIDQIAAIRKEPRDNG